MLEQRLGDKVGGSDIGVESKLLAQFQDTLLRSDGSNTPLGSTDSTYVGSDTGV